MSFELNSKKPMIPQKEISHIFKSFINSFIVFILDENMIFKFYNKNFKSLLKIPKNEILDHSLLEFLEEKKIEYLQQSNVILELNFKWNSEKRILKGLWHKNYQNHFLFIGIDITDIQLKDSTNHFQKELFEILKFSLETSDLKTFLDKTLKHIVKIPWLSLEARGGFMLNKEGELQLISYYNVSDSLVKMCNKVSFGRCLCGKAAELKEIIYKSHVDEEHENRPEGIKPHGHYNVPILHGDQLLGVLFLYLKEGHQKQEQEIKFLKELSAIIALVLLRFQFENEYQTSILKLIRSNEIMIENLKKINMLEEFIKIYVPDTIKNELVNKTKHNQKVHFYLESNFYLLLNISGLIRFSEIFPLQKVYETIQEYYAPIIDCIIRHNGDVEQYLEDRIFGIFKNSSDLINCSLEIKKILFEINSQREQFFLKPFHFQMALNFGPTFFGIIGSKNRKNWLRYGETIRWLISMQKKCDRDKIIVSEEIYQIEKEHYKFSKPFKIIKNENNFIVARYLLS